MLGHQPRTSRRVVCPPLPLLLGCSPWPTRRHSQNASMAVFVIIGLPTDLRAYMHRLTYLPAY